MDLVQKLNSLETSFNKAAGKHNAVKFEQECLYARQLLEGNNYLMSIAQKNPRSLENAVMNIAAIGLSLNPAQGHAYLVPRDQKVCLDPSYKGLAHLAQESGSIRWVQAELVYSEDDFSFTGFGQKPEHKFNPFKKDRGEVIGAYCVARTSDGDYLTTMMPIDDIHAIRERSEAYKAYMNKKTRQCPWVDFYKEMVKKTVVKNASKLWPKSERAYRLDEAVMLDHETNAVQLTDEAPEKTVETVDYKIQAELVDKIKAKLAELTDGRPPAEKGQFMVAHLKVRSFDDIKRRKPEELQKNLDQLNEMKPIKPTVEEPGEEKPKPRSVKDVSFNLND